MSNETEITTGRLQVQTREGMDRNRMEGLVPGRVSRRRNPNVLVIKAPRSLDLGISQEISSNQIATVGHISRVRPAFHRDYVEPRELGVVTAWS